MFIGLFLTRTLDKLIIDRHYTVQRVMEATKQWGEGVIDDENAETKQEAYDPGYVLHMLLGPAEPLFGNGSLCRQFLW